MSTKKHRVPKPGTGFTLLRVLGIILEVIGWFTIAGSVIGFIILLIKAGPDLLAALSYSGSQQGAGFYLMILLVWFLVPLVAGLVGGASLLVGFLFHRLATRPAEALNPG